MRYYNEVDVPKPVHTIMLNCMFAPKNGERVRKEPKDDLFDQINAGRLNDYLKTHMKDLSAKVFRTYNASTVLEMQLSSKGKEQEIKPTCDVNTKVKFFNDCNRDVALLCNHKKAAAKGLKEKIEQMEGVI